MQDINNDVLPTEILSYGAYVCLRIERQPLSELASLDVPALVDRFGLQNEFDPRDEPSAESVAFLRRTGASARDISDDTLLNADVVIHVASKNALPVQEFCSELKTLLGPRANLQILRGVTRPLSYTGTAMHNFAYSHQVTQKSGSIMPNGFLVPMSKTPAWWKKTWLERHTYFLPRFDGDGRIVNEGHVLAAADGIACLLRRTYRSEAVPAPEGTYDFLNYFECKNEDIPTFHAVCASLRDIRRNPEWQFVREGPTWHGRRVKTWSELFA